MIRGRNNGGVAFTGKQCEELEKQVLTFRYLMSGVAVPPALMSSVITSSASSNSSLFPHHQQHHLPIGSSYFQVGYGRKIDPEPGRCKRTDGKKWRCSKEAHQDSKYCEKHMHRSKSKAKKQFNALNNNNIINISPTKTAITTTSSAAVKSYSPYPAISYCPVSQCSYPNKFQPKSSTFYPFMSTQSSSSSNVSMSVRDDGTSPNWLGLDGEFLDQPRKEIVRYSNSHMKGAVEESSFSGLEASKEEHNVGEDEEHESQKLYHHFLGDWPTKLKNSHALGRFSTTN